MNSIERLINREFSCIRPAQSVADALTLMDKGDTELLVVKEKDAVKGIITANELNSRNPNRLIADIPIKKVKPLQAYTSVEEAYNLLEQNRQCGLPVVDKNNKITGVIYRHKIGAFLSTALWSVLSNDQERKR